MEYLTLLSRRDRALTLASYETRCQERMQLALFRIVDGNYGAEVTAASNAMFEAKTRISTTFRTMGSGLLTPNFISDAASPSMSVTDMEQRLIFPSNWKEGVKKDDAPFVALLKQFDQDKKAYEKAADDHAQLVNAVRDELKGKTGADIGLQAIQTLEARLSRIRDEREKNKTRLQDLEEVLSRYESWIEALTAQGTDRPILDEIAYQVDKSHNTSQASLDCTYLDKFYEAVTDRLKKKDETHNDKTAAPLLTLLISSTGAFYRNLLVRYFNQPPAAQTLFVTLLIGALGALTLNVLRLSKVGWWATYSDPAWGEILVSPFLGALAAFGIYLIGSAGLLLTSDVRNGGSALSTSFIGMLGFVSGLLYDEAFGRVRRVGSRIFSGDDTGDDGTGARPEDRELAKTLRAANASLVASLVLKYNVGLRLARESSFTLFVPSDQAIGSLNLKSWTDINDKQKDAFEKWFRHHHAQKAIFQKDVVSGASTSLVMDDTSTVAMNVDASGLKVGGAQVLIPDVAWERSVIHILGTTIP